jgi:hypothetical protein
LGGFSQSDLKQIPLCPPFSKGDLNAKGYLRISSNRENSKPKELMGRGWTLREEKILLPPKI